MSIHIFLQVWSTHSDTLEKRACLFCIELSIYWFFSCADPESFIRGGPTLPHWLQFRGERIQIPLKAGQHRPASETPFNRLIALRILIISRWSWPPVPPPSGSAHVFEHTTYFGGGVGGGLGNSENLESLTMDVILPGLKTPIDLPIIVIRSLPRWNPGMRQAISDKVTNHLTRKRCACVWACVSSPLASR